jgi:uncharacterized protein (DUF3820 family)
MRVRVEVPDRLAAQIEPVLLQRGLSLDEVVRLYLRSLVTTSERMAALDVKSEMPFGKFKGEQIGVIIRVDPDYVAWMLANSKSFKLTPEALSLLEAVQASVEDNPALAANAA